MFVLNAIVGAVAATTATVDGECVRYMDANYAPASTATDGPSHNAGP